MDDNLRKLQLVELELLHAFDAVCRENGITYFAMGGTLLGAVRHRGFIPWDDDMDLGVPRPDYERLCDIMESKGKKETFYFRTYKNDDSYLRFFAHIENTEVNVIRHDKMKEEHAHAWIDIFPLDGMPDNRVMRRIRTYRVMMARAVYRFSVFDTLVDVEKKGRPFYERALIFIGLHTPVQKLFHTKKCLRRLERVLKRTDYTSSHYLINAMGVKKFKEVFPKKCYGEGAMYPFEDTEIRGPVDYDFVLRQLYGDYMTLPPEDERNHHGLECAE